EVCVFFASRRRHTRLVSDWSSDVCSSDLALRRDRLGPARRGRTAICEGMRLPQERCEARKMEGGGSSGTLRRLRVRDAQRGEARSEERRVGKEGRAWGEPEG